MSASSLAVLLQCFAFGFARHHGSVAALCHRFTLGLVVLLRCFAIGLRSALWFCCGVLPSVHACLFHVVKKRRLAMCSVPIPQGRDRHSCVLVPFWGYLPLWVHFGFARFFMAISTGYRSTEDGAGGWRRGLCAFLRGHIGLEILSAGSTLGLRAPNLRQRVFDSLDSPHAAAGLGWCVFAAPSPGYTERPDRL